jgi:phospholipid/cholesterol/gamma-HCH transport system substrate-binding protein
MTNVLVKSIIFTLVTVLATIALAATIRNSTSGDLREYKAIFTDATSLNRGDDVRMAGVKVGTVKNVEVHDDKYAKVTFTVSTSTPLTQGTKAELRFRNMVGQRYISMMPPTSPGTALKPGYTFTVDETKPSLDLTLLFNGFQPLFQFLNPKDVNALSEQIIAVFQGEGATVEGLISSTASLTQTLADKDQVIGELISSLDSVLTVVNDRSDQLDTTLITFQQLVSGLAEDRKTIGQSIDGLAGLTTSVGDLFNEARAPLKGSIAALGTLSENLADAEPVLDRFFKNLPTKFDKIGRIGSYGSWLNFYICSIDGAIPMPEGYMGGLGVEPVNGRCQG